jgi:Family of unknown function (DUF6290)
MRSIRLDDRLDEITRKAASIEGASVSEFMRRAIAERAERTLADGAQERLKDVLGSVHGGGGHARDTGKAFADLLEQQSGRS